ncbi:MAG TPA: T9SS type A sorting domain-containing protein [Puia sp.]|uniref:T9SS type A sorting domain-containing protein n=1 Tax=Puia sp. TaxID=2045100 RepID=UPI002B619A62|nr:T9SS type A sorting domain-containing protein [Puia sp.]HVU94211.1 T9SS type A sorting domain-containing protein [Puia sp.]
MKKILLILAAFAAAFEGKAQINAYAAVTGISGTTLSLSNVNQTYHTFNAGDQIIIMQMQDDVVGSKKNNNSNYGKVGMAANAGIYEVATIASVAGLPNSLTVTAAPAHAYAFGGASSVQIISFRKYGSPDYVTTAAITALPWNGKIGGVVAMQVSGKLTVAYPITADGAGFRGGSASANYEVNCETAVYASSSSNYAARGEGIQVNNTGYLYGRNPLASGGGGGSDDNGGGAGGGNYSAGGQGGAGWTCTMTPVGGYGGNALSAYIQNSRFFMGGGGGGGQQNNSVGSAGSNGGGIVILKANSLATSCSGSVTISANGANAANSGNDGAGGGGAGGTVLMNVNTFSASASCPLKVQGNGGNGGNVTDANSHGGGGGGGQGVVLYPGAQPTTNITTTTNVGVGGLNSGSAGASSANSGSGTNSAGVLANSGFVFLPVKLAAFTGQLVDGSVVLKWETAMEKNNDHFEIERSVSGGDFATIGEVRGVGNSDVLTDYAFTDPAPVAGVNSYRLKQVDIDGTATYSAVVAIEVSVAAGNFTVYPNPVVDAFTVRLSGVTAGSCTVTLFDLSGKAVYMTTAQANGALIPVTLSRRPVPGIYVISVRTQQAQMTGKIVVR